MKKSEKPFVVEDLAARLKDAKSVAVIDYQGLATKQLNELRTKIKAVGGVFMVAKNTLLKLAFESARGTRGTLDSRDTLLTGPTAVVFAEQDEIAPLQIIGKAIKESGLPKLKFGIFDNDIVDSAKLLTLSSLPGKNNIEKSQIYIIYFKASRFLTLNTVDIIGQ